MAAKPPTTTHWDAMANPPGAKPPSNRQSRAHLEVHVVPGTEAPASPGIVPPAAPEPTPTPQVVPPQPMARAVLLILKQRYRDWVAAGGTPIHGPVSPTSAILTGGTVANPATLYTTLHAMTNAGFAITVNGTVQQIGPLNLTTATDLNAIAAAIDGPLTAATCVWQAAPSNRFFITTTATGAAATLSFAAAPASGTDISATIQLTAATGATLVAGASPAPLDVAA